MNTDQKLLIHLLSCAIRNEKPSNIDFKRINWDYIVSESMEHSIYPLLYPVIKTLSEPDVISSDLKDKWKCNTLKVAIQLLTQIIQMSKVFKEFDLANIPVIALKGLILRNLYPVPDLRTMGDSDILVHEKDIDRVRTLLTDMGYVEAKDSTPAHIAFIHKYFRHIEVHWTLADTRYISDVSPFEKRIWDRAVLKKISDADALCLCPEDFLIHLLVHMAVHMRSGGFGLRQLCDIVLLVEKEGAQICWEAFNKAIESIGLEKFTAAIFKVCNILFNLKTPESLNMASVDNKYVKMLINDILDSGVFGNRSLDRVYGNNLLNAKATSKDVKPAKMSSVINIICPPVSTLSDTYRYAKKHRFLTPVAWIHHFVSGVLNARYSLFDKLRFLFFSTSTFKKRSILVKNLEL